MLLSEAVDRLIGIAMERTKDREKRAELQFVRGIILGGIQEFGDIDLQIEIRRVPMEARGAEAE